MKTANFFASLPNDLSREVFEELIRTPSVRIERIVSKGHTSPENGWYDQEENEWVMVLQGRGRLEFEDGSVYELGPGDHFNIPAHAKHKVWTEPEAVTLWLAVFYR